MERVYKFATNNNYKGTLEMYCLKYYDYSKDGDTRFARNCEYCLNDDYFAIELINTNIGSYVMLIYKDYVNDYLDCNEESSKEEFFNAKKEIEGEEVNYGFVDKNGKYNILTKDEFADKMMELKELREE